MKIINYGREIVTYRIKGQKYEFLPKIPTLVDKRIVTLENLQNCYGTILCEYTEPTQITLNKEVQQWQATLNDNREEILINLTELDNGPLFEEICGTVEQSEETNPVEQDIEETTNTEFVAEPTEEIKAKTEKEPKKRGRAKRK